MPDSNTTDNQDPNLGSVQAPQEGDNPDASTEPGEAGGAKTDEIKAAEQDPSTAEETNPVAEATGSESKDPYAEGQHIANPEPNNGSSEDSPDEL
jgi:hypothetical protein